MTAAPTAEIYEDPTPSDKACPTPAAQAASARREAFRAAPFHWRGQELLPFTPSREDLWSFLREHAGHPPLTDIYNGPGRMFRADATIILWLCSHVPAQWKNYLRDHDAWLAAIAEWGDDEKNIGYDLDLEAVTLAYKIFNRAHSTRAIHADDGPPSSGLGEE
jgi:hypothetical protein